jgi:hypothetical protein
MKCSATQFRPLYNSNDKRERREIEAEGIKSECYARVFTGRIAPFFSRLWWTRRQRRIKIIKKEPFYPYTLQLLPLTFTIAMSRIRILSEHLANQIAAGEVV